MILMKATVYKDLCIGCGVCEDVCPEVFRMNDDGLAEVIVDLIDESVLDKAKEAQAECAVDAITIE